MALSSCDDPGKCPRCGAPVAASDATPVCCDGCDTAVFVASGRMFAATAWPRRVEADEVPRLLADALHHWRAAGAAHLVEVQRVSLPYWLGGDERLRAAFPTVIDAAAELPAPAVDTVPARLSSLPAVAPGAEAQQLVLLPAFDVVYEVDGRSFHAIVDGHDGAVLADLHPSPHQARLQLAMAAVLAFDVAVFALTAYFAPDNVWRTLLIAALAAPLHALTNATLNLVDRRRP